MDRETLAWALVLSVGPGVGITGFVTYVTAGGPVEPLAVGVGGATALVIFAVVAYASSVGSADEEREGGRLP